MAFFTIKNKAFHFSRLIADVLMFISVVVYQALDKNGEARAVALDISFGMLTFFTR